MNGPGTFRSSDGTPVAFSDAVSAWSEAGYLVLVDVASRYRAVITYKELGQEVQERTGIATRSLLMNWIGTVLEAVARSCAERGDVQLTSLCVHQDGTVGDGYAGAIERYSGARPSDAEMHAAHARLDCYRKYAADVPADGGFPRLTMQEIARRRASQPAVPEPRCAVHHTVLPRTGVCDDCN